MPAAPQLAGLGTGIPVPAAVRSVAEARLVIDLGDVRVHDTPAAHALAQRYQAQALTVGRDVVFNRGRYRPGSLAGRRLLGHELAHVAQQTAGDAQPAEPSGPSHEYAADLTGRALASGTGNVSAGPPAAIGLQCAPLDDEEIAQLSAADTDQRIADNDFEALGRKLSPAYFAQLEHEHEQLAQHADTLRRVAQAALDSVVLQVVAEVAGVEVIVGELVSQMPVRPSAYALNEVRGVMGRLVQDERFIVQLAAPGAPAAIPESLAKVRALKVLMRSVVHIAEAWHEANPMGESLGMWNERQGVAAAGWAERQWDKGGAHYISGFFGYAGSYGLAFLNTAESVASVGFHEAANAVATAYANGDISWDEGVSILHKAAWRAILTAAVTRGLGRAATSLVGGAAGEFGLARSALITRIGVGGVSGALTAGGGLGTQAGLTSVMAPAHPSHVGQAIWAQGIPKGRDWLIAIPIGMILGAGGGAAGFARDRASLVGRQLDLPGGGRGEIISLETNGNVVLRPVGSRLTAPAPPPPATIPLVFDEASGTWVAETGGTPTGSGPGATGPAGGASQAGSTALTRTAPTAPAAAAVASGTADPANLAPRVPEALRSPPSPIGPLKALPPEAVKAAVAKPLESGAERLDAFVRRAEMYGFATPSRLAQVLAQPPEIFDRAMTDLEAQLDDHVQRVGTAQRGQIELEQAEAGVWGDEAGKPGEVRSRPPTTTKLVPARRSQIDAAFQLGVTGGELRAAADGIKLRDWNPPDAHILEYGRGFDAIGDDAGVVVLEWKGEGSKVRGAQMTSRWVGERIAKLKALSNHPIADELLAAAENGKLRGRVYTTRTVEGQPVTTSYDVPFDPKVVRAAYETRMGQLVPGSAPKAVPTSSK